MAFRLLDLWHGDVASLPRFSFPGRGRYVPCPYVECTGNKKLFIAAVPDNVIGGRRWRLQVRDETLAIELLEESDLLGPDFRRTTVPARFYWINVAERVRRAKLWLGTDTMRSMFLTYYSSHQKRALAVHRLLGWTFCCPKFLLSERWSPDYGVEHWDGHHENNELENLYLWTAAGESGHRAYSGFQGALVTWQQQQQANQ